VCGFISLIFSGRSEEIEIIDDFDPFDIDVEDSLSRRCEENFSKTKRDVVAAVWNRKGVGGRRIPVSLTLVERIVGRSADRRAGCV